MKLLLLSLLWWLNVVVADISYWSANRDDDYQDIRHFKINIPRKMRHDSHRVHSVYEPARLSVVTLSVSDTSTDTGTYVESGDLLWSRFNSLLSSAVNRDHMVKCDIRIGSGQKGRKIASSAEVHVDADANSGIPELEELRALHFASDGCEPNLVQFLSLYTDAVNAYAHPLFIFDSSNNKSGMANDSSRRHPILSRDKLVDVLLLPVSALQGLKQRVDEERTGRRKGLFFLGSILRQLSAISKSVVLALDYAVSGPATSLWSSNLILEALVSDYLHMSEQLDSDSGSGSRSRSVSDNVSRFCVYALSLNDVSGKATGSSEEAFSTNFPCFHRILLPDTVSYLQKVSYNSNTDANSDHVGSTKEADFGARRELETALYYMRTVTAAHAQLETYRRGQTVQQGASRTAVVDMRSVRLLSSLEFVAEQVTGLYGHASSELVGANSHIKSHATGRVIGIDGDTLRLRGGHLDSDLKLRCQTEYGWDVVDITHGLSEVLAAQQRWEEKTQGIDSESAFFAAGDSGFVADLREQGGSYIVLAMPAAAFIQQQTTAAIIDSSRTEQMSMSRNFSCNGSCSSSESESVDDVTGSRSGTQAEPPGPSRFQRSFVGPFGSVRNNKCLSLCLAFSQIRTADTEINGRGAQVSADIVDVDAEAIAICGCNRIRSASSHTSTPSISSANSSIGIVKGRQYARQWHYWGELLPVASIAFHEDLLLSYKSTIAAYRDQYSIIQVWRDRSDADEVATKSECNSNSNSNSSVDGDSGAAVADESNWKAVMHFLSLYIDRMDSYYAFSVLSRGIVRKKAWLPNELAASTASGGEGDNSYGHWMFKTRYVSLDRSRGKTAVPRIGVPFGLVVEALPHQVDQQKDAGTTGTGTKYKHWAMAVNGLEYDFTPFLPTDSVKTPSMTEILKRIRIQMHESGQSVNTWASIRSVVSSVENDSSAQTTRYFVGDTALPNIAAVFNIMPDDDPGQVLLTLLNQYELGDDTMPSIAFQIGRHLLPPSEVGSPVHVLARRQASLKFLMEAIKEEVALSNAYDSSRKQKQQGGSRYVHLQRVDSAVGSGIGVGTGAGGGSIRTGPSMSVGSAGSAATTEHALSSLNPADGASLGYIFGERNQIERFIERLPSSTNASLGAGGDVVSTGSLLAQTCSFEDINAQLVGESGRDYANIRDNYVGLDPSVSSISPSHSYRFHSADAVVIGMTTCKRLETFKITMAALMPAIGYYQYTLSNSTSSYTIHSTDGSLFDTNLVGDDQGADASATAALYSEITRRFILYKFVKRVIIVDDSSSDADRAEMLRLYSDFTFIMKSRSERGHANSMNMLMAHVPASCRYFIYLEDDWRLMPVPYVTRELYHSFQQLNAVYGAAKGGDGSETTSGDALIDALLPPLNVNDAHSSGTGSGIHQRYFGLGVLAGIHIMQQSHVTEHTVSDTDVNVDLSTVGTGVGVGVGAGANGKARSVKGNGFAWKSRTFKEPIAQVLFNDQVSDCTARGFVYMPPAHPLFSRYHCKESEGISDSEETVGRVDDKLWNLGYSNPEIGFGGWARTAILKLPRDAAVDSERRNSESLESLESEASEVSIPYAIHEFGLASNVEVYADRIHQHATWPGFSLNPGVWDLQQIRSAFNRCVSRSHRGLRKSNRNREPGGTGASTQVPLFDEDDQSFEQEWSILAHTLGLTTSFFGANFFEHTGERVSAYVLNNYTRIWDNNRSTLLEMDYFWSKAKLFDDD